MEQLIIINCSLVSNNHNQAKFTKNMELSMMIILTKKQARQDL